MGFFQNSVINKYLVKLDKPTTQNAYAKFRAHFHNATIQDNIRNSKEEQYQGEFLIDLFVNVLGYTKNPTPNFNLTTEYKNVKDSKKADGAIIINEIVKAVIELKGTNTTDLNKIEVQAFGYKNNQPECEYVITSNFEKLRFYVDNAIEYLEFNLFTLSEKEFELLYICLSYDSIAKGLPKQIKDESVSQEALITKKLYHDYSVFKSELYHSLVKLNPQYEPLELFKKSQKLLDRFLFIFFAEDRQLLPTNLIFRINKEWQQLREMRIEVSLYDRYKIYFNDLNNGAKVSLPAFSQTASKQKEEFEIYAYNGGLFNTDELLNDIKIDDALLFSHTEKLSNYDFASEVDVNVLGHIFENSLNDVDEIKAQLEGQEVDKTKTKRKKDGVFYTPKYITKYIVDNTVGKLCIEKKEELKINEDDYKIDKKRTTKAKQILLDNLEAYRKWLLQLTICDPACGSGAFLNQALDFLIAEHAYIDELQAKVLNVPMVLSDIEGSILENNLFGVDINEESVEIAKLSLWLRTAQPNRKLNDLNSNIKCGNSLIDDVSVAGDKAFNWEQEFPQVFQNTEFDKNYISVDKRLARKNVFVTKDNLGDYKDDSFGIYNEFHEPKLKYKTTKEKKHGFDVVIGNPPYLNMTLTNTGIKFLNHYAKNYESIKSANSKNLFTLFNERSTALVKHNGLISFIVPEGFLKTRSYNECVKKMNETGFIKKATYFEDWVFEDATTGSMIFEYINNSDSDLYFEEFIINKKREVCSVKNVMNPIVAKYNDLNFPSLVEICDTFKGMAVKNREEFISKEQKNLPNKFLLGNCIDRYILKNVFYCDYEKLTIVGGTKKIEKHNIFPRILIRRTGDFLCCVMLDEPALTESTLYSCSIKNTEYDIHYLLAILNSSFLTYIVRQNMITNEQAFPQILMSDIELLKIPNINKNSQKVFKEKTSVVLALNKELHSQVQKFHRSMERRFDLKELSNKLKDWYLLSFKEFHLELSKKKIKIPLNDLADWDDYFDIESKKALELKSKIDATDKEIDQMVYKLYNLTEEEIAIVEKS